MRLDGVLFVRALNAAFSESQGIRPFDIAQNRTRSRDRSRSSHETRERRMR